MLRRKSTLQWSEKHVLLNGRPFRREEWPLLIDILETMDKHQGASFLVFGAVQTVKTLGAQLRYARNMQVDPKPSLWYTRTDDQADSLVDSKLNPLIDSTPLGLRAFFANPNKHTRKRIQLPCGPSSDVLSAGPVINRQQRSAQEINMDEAWSYDVDWFSQISNRRAASEYSWNWREIYTTTAPEHGHPVEKKWADCDQRHIQWACPQCSQLFAPDFGEPDKPGGVKFQCVRQEDGRLDKAAVITSTRYECPHCQHRMKFSAGLIRDLNAPLRWKAMNPKPAPNCYGWHIHDVMVRDWGLLAVEFQLAIDAMKLGDIKLLRDVVMMRFAKPWKVTEQVREKKTRNIGNYRMGDAWDELAKDEYGIPIAAVCVDVQKDHYVVVVRGWASRARSRALWAEKVPGAGAIADIAARFGIPPYRVFLDGRFEATRVGRLCANHGWHMLMGDTANDYLHSHDKQRRIYSEPQEINPFIGTDTAGIHLRFLFSKQRALDSLALLRTLTDDQGNDPKHTAAQDMPEWYWKECEAHYRRIVKSQDGSERTEWAGLKDDHAGDCEAMQVVFAAMAGYVGTDTATEAHAP